MLLNVLVTSVFYQVKNFTIKQYEKLKPAGESIIAFLITHNLFYINTNSGSIK